MKKQSFILEDFLCCKFTYVCATNHKQNDFVFCWKLRPLSFWLYHLSRCCLIQVCCGTGRKEWNLDGLIAEKATLGHLIDFPPLLTLHMAPLYLAFPFCLLNRALMNPLPTDLAASRSQSALSLSISSAARQKISLEAKWGNKAYSVTASAEKEKRTVTRYEWNQICLTCLAAMTAFHAGGECQDWVNGMKLLTEALTD